MKRRSILLVLCCAGSFWGLYGWDWPLGKLALTMDFATDYQGSFLTGVVFRSPETRVAAVEKGEIVLAAEAGRTRRGTFPLAFGGTVVLQHERGIRTVYTGVGELEPVPSGTLERGAAIGALARMDDGNSTPLLFRVLDSTWQGAINPLVIFPRIVDDRLPVITVAQAELPETGQRINLVDRMEMTAPGFGLFVQLRDTIGPRSLSGERAPSSAAALPQEIRVIWNGSLVYSSSKLAARVSPDNPGRLWLVSNRLGEHAALYRPDGFVSMGTLKLADGVNRLEIRAADLDGNRTSTSYRIIHPARALQP